VKLREERAETVIVHWDCECGGEMKFSGSGFSNAAGSSWHHRCGACGREEVAARAYPAVEHRKADGKLPSERADEIATELAAAACKRGEFRDWRNPNEDDKTAALWQVLDEFIGRKAP
jgi:hypothetical protein